MWFLLQVVYSAAGEIKLTFNKELENKQYLKLWYQASLVCSVVKNLPVMQEMQVWSLGREDPMEKEMAAHSSIIVWKISWTEEPGELQSMGSQRVRHDWATNTYLEGFLWFIVKHHF